MKKIIVAAGSIFILAACNPDKDMVNAVVIDTGDITPDGCGFLLKLEDSAMIKPVNLPSAYSHDGMPVKLTYDFSGQKDTCDYGPKIFDLVQIDRIKVNY